LKKEIILIGMGGHCNACIDVIENTGKFKIAGLIAKNASVKNKNLKYKTLGTDADLKKIFNKYKYAHVAIGQIKNLDLRKKIFEKLKKIGFVLPTIISKNSYVSKQSSIGEGTIIMHDSIINYNAKIGVNSIINSKALIEHDCIIGSHTHVSTGCILNGKTVIGDQCFIGSSSVSKGNKKIKNKTFVKMLSKI
jgi:sugar O-acyltransferase (sialic acid O-acetyltransferase NeuD family)